MTGSRAAGLHGLKVGIVNKPNSVFGRLHVCLIYSYRLVSPTARAVGIDDIDRLENESRCLHLGAQVGEFEYVDGRAFNSDFLPMLETYSRTRHPTEDEQETALHDNNLQVFQTKKKTRRGEKKSNRRK